MSKKKKKQDFSVYEDREALCPHFEKCGGCTLQKISYEKQLEIKSSEVCSLIFAAEEVSAAEETSSAEAASETEEISTTRAASAKTFEGILPSPLQEGYRNKMEFTFGDEYKGGPFALGLHMRGSFMNIVNITDCHLVHDDMNVIRNATRGFFAEYYDKGILSFRNNKTRSGYLRHLLLRRAGSTGEILAALVTTSQTSGFESEEIMLKKFKDALLNLRINGKIVGILHIVNDAISDVVQSDRTDILYGRDYVFEELLGLRFKVSVFSFFQTNTKGAEILYSKAREYARDAHGLLFDLYSGTGTIAQLMSEAVDKVIGVEIVEEAVEAARENARLNDIENVSFIASDVFKALDQLPVPDSLILDPPREGIQPKALGRILNYNVENIVYVSCNPKSLAADLKSFYLAGYKAAKVCCVDMFPQTGHVETVVLLSKNT